MPPTVTKLPSPDREGQGVGSTMTPIQTTRMTNFRWVICGLLFLATTVNYMDRQVL